ncbi:GIY-YIG nuclease family protein [soil metagenome]
MAYVYILCCADGSYYVGSTRDIDARMQQHGSGKGSAYTAKRMPVELAYAEEFTNIGDAYEREKQIQGWSRRKREALIEGRFDDLPSLSHRAENGEAASS